MRRVVACLFAFSLAASLARAAERADEWPHYKGNAGFTGVSADASVKPPLKLVWSYRLDGDASNDAGGGPIVAGGLVFVPVYNTRSIVALDAKDGRFVWQHNGFPAALRKVPTYHDGRLFLWNQQPKSSTVVALDAATGEPLWQKSLAPEGTDPHRAGLPVAHGLVFCSEGGEEPAVVALDEKSGEVAWRAGLGKDDGQAVTCPAVAGGTVFVGTLTGFGWRKGEHGAVVALDAATGKTLWRRPGIFPNHTLASDGTVVACPMFGKEDAKHRKHFLLNATTGETLWTGVDRFHYSPSTITGNLILVKPYGGAFAAVDRETGKERWTFDAKTNSGCCSPVVSGRFAYMGTGVLPPGDTESLASFKHVDAPREKGRAGTLFAVDLETGKPVWFFGTGNTICGEPAIAYGKLYFAGRDGRVYCFAPAKEGEPTVPEAKDLSAGATAAEVTALLDAKFADEPRAGKDWTMQGGTPDRESRVDADIAPPLELAWKLDVGKRIITSAAVREGRVFIGSEAGRIVAAVLHTGRLLWEFPAGVPVRCSPAVAGGLVFCGADSGEFFALDVETGKPKWKFACGGPVQASPAVVAGVVIFGANDHHVYALDRFTGRKLWSFRMRDYSITAPPVVHGGRVFVGQGTDWVWALDLLTGKELWRSYVPVTVEAVAWYDGKLYARSPNWIVELDPETGRRLRIGAATYGSGGLAFSGSELFYSGVQGQYGMSGASVIDLSQPGTELRNLPILEGVLSLKPKGLKSTNELGAMGTPLVVGDRLCFATLGGKVHLTAKDGGKLWSFALGGPSHATPVAADGMLVAGCDDGLLYAFRGASDKAPSQP